MFKQSWTKLYLIFVNLYHLFFSLKKAQISFALYEKQSLLNIWRFFNRGQEHHIKRIHSLRNKNTELLFKRFHREMEAIVGVMRHTVCSIDTGHTGLEKDCFTTLHFELHRKIISAIITLSSHGAEVGALL